MYVSRTAAQRDVCQCQVRQAGWTGIIVHDRVMQQRQAAIPRNRCRVVPVTSATTAFHSLVHARPHRPA
jgi:hypothetical protein